MSIFADDPPNLADLHSFTQHLDTDRSTEDPITPETRQEVAAYLLGYAARLRFQHTITPTVESMYRERVDLLGPVECSLSITLANSCRVSFARGWTAAGEALNLAIT